MPLMKSKSKKAFKHNVEAEMHAGKPQPQALAIAYSVKRKNAKKKASGGTVESGSPDMNMADGGEAKPRILSKEERHKMRSKAEHEKFSKSLGRNRGGGSSGPVNNMDRHHYYGINQQSERDEPGVSNMGHKVRNPGNYMTDVKDDARDKIKSMKKATHPKIEGIYDAKGGKVPYAKGGEISAANEKRPMPDNEYDDAHSVSRNSGNKPPKNDNWLDQPTVAQAQKNNSRAVLPIKRPKMVPSDAFSTRMYDEEGNLQSSASPGPYDAQPPRHDDEEGPDRQGPKVRDMEDEHSTHRKPYAKGGEIEPSDEKRHADGKYEDDLLDLPPSEDEGASMARSENEEGPDRQGPDVPDMEREHSNGREPYARGGEVDPEEEMAIEHAASIAAAIMAKRKFARGGAILSEDSMESYPEEDQADLNRNAEEDANMEDKASFDALRKENYDEEDALRQADNPEDSAQHGDEEEMDSENKHDRSIVSQIRSKMKKRSPISR